MALALARIGVRTTLRLCREVSHQVAKGRIILWMLSNGRWLALPHPCNRGGVLQDCKDESQNLPDKLADPVLHPAGLAYGCGVIAMIVISPFSGP